MTVNHIQKLRDAARDQSCVRCGANDGTIVLAHYTGPRRHSFGGGMSHKGHDAIGAHLCMTCHQYFDTAGKDKESRWELSEEFLFLCAVTVMRLFDQGVVR